MSYIKNDGYVLFMVARLGDAVRHDGAEALLVNLISIVAAAPELRSHTFSC